MSKTKVEQIHDLLKSIETGEAGPVAVVNEAKYVQHNPQTHEGSTGLAQLFKRISLTGPKVNMVRGFEDGEYVFGHMEYDFATRKICFEVFRFEDGQAVEHWDNIQEHVGPNSSGHSMVDGAVEIADREKTEENRAQVRSFVEGVLIGGAHKRFGKFIAADYVEHNPHLTDDLADLEAHFLAGSDGQRHIDYQTCHRVLAEGNFVLSVCEGERDGAHTAFYDLFRLAGGKIVEHWDTTERVAPKSEWKNHNGKF